MNPGAYGQPAQRVGIIPLGMKNALGAVVSWKNVPPGTRRITFMLNRVSTTAGGQLSIRLIKNDTSIAANYQSTASTVGNANSTTVTNATTEMLFGGASSGATSVTGRVTLMRNDKGDWILESVISRSGDLAGVFSTASLLAGQSSAEELKGFEFRTDTGTFDAGDVSAYAELDAQP